MREFHKNEEFCTHCLVHTTFWRGGNSWGVDRCPVCKGEDAILWQNMSYIQRHKAIKLFEEWWKKERIGIKKEN